ncbi:MAG: VWA domain-containing protein [Spirochaetia bacterium]|nr:VWA domain-containing protein [Spirochaetia bacterium]
MRKNINRCKIFPAVLFFLIILSTAIWGENISISQLDTSKLFVSSSLDCYVRVTDSEGNPQAITGKPEELFSLFHIEENKSKYLPVLEIKKNSDSMEGITFLLLLDNSGSMYESPEGKNDGSKSAIAIRAAKTFFSRLDPEKDKGGLALFNREYRLLSKPEKNMRQIEDRFTAIEEPSRDESYTELYYTIVKAAEDMGKTAGRKAIILLSDGENYPYFEKSGKPHPLFGKDYYIPQQAAAALSENEVTLYAVNFSKEKDIPLAEIAVISGGRVFDASDEDELTGVYENIRNSINEEYRIKVKVPVTFSKSPLIEVEYNEQSRDRRGYSPALIFGAGKARSLKSQFILIISGILLWGSLFFIKLEKPANQAELTKLASGAGKAFTKTMVLSSPNTVIGGSRSADYTITGIPQLADSHATIVHNEKTDAYTLVSDREIRVNNKPVKKRILKPGDVINIEGATMVFDAPDKNKTGK